MSLYCDARSVNHVTEATWPQQRQAGQPRPLSIRPEMLIAYRTGLTDQFNGPAEKFLVAMHGAMSGGRGSGGCGFYGMVIKVIVMMKLSRLPSKTPCTRHSRRIPCTYPQFQFPIDFCITLALTLTSDPGAAAFANSVEATAASFIQCARLASS